ncbi:MAG: type II secretion system major pseudopilin GspG [Acetobacteraceae bacterium]
MPEPRRSAAGREAGFTLIELLVVIVILGLLIGLVAPAALRLLGGARRSIARQSVEQLGSILDLYKLDVGSYPTTAQGLEALRRRPQGVAGWNGPYLQHGKRLRDPWNHRFVYRAPSVRPGLSYDLCSRGPDDGTGTPGAAGAICNR